MPTPGKPARHREIAAELPSTRPALLPPGDLLTSRPPDAAAQTSHLPDIWVANYEDEMFALYRNDGDAFFLHVSQPAGVTALGQLFVGFGTACMDFERDGDEDIVVANGHVIKYPRAASRRQRALYLENHQGQFHRATFPPESYFDRHHEGRGLAVADLDNDGDLDLAISHLNDPIALLRNECQEESWLGVQLIGVCSNRGSIGARLTLQTDKGILMRQIKGGGSHLSTSDPSVFWGLAEGAHVENLTIHWPGGKTQVIVSPETRHVLTVVEPVNDEDA